MLLVCIFFLQQPFSNKLSKNYRSFYCQWRGLPFPGWIHIVFLLTVIWSKSAKPLLLTPPNESLCNYIVDGYNSQSFDIFLTKQLLKKSVLYTHNPGTCCMKSHLWFQPGTMGVIKSTGMEILKMIVTRFVFALMRAHMTPVSVLNMWSIR